MKHRIFTKNILWNRYDKEIFCPMCGSSCGKGMGSGYIYMLHHTLGCSSAKLHYSK